MSLWQTRNKYTIIFDTNFFINLKYIYGKKAVEVLSKVNNLWSKEGYKIGATPMVLIELEDANLSNYIKKHMVLVELPIYEVNLVKSNVSSHFGRNYTKGGKKTDYELIALSRKLEYIIVTTDQGIRKDNYTNKERVFGVSVFALESFNTIKDPFFKDLSRDFFVHRMKTFFTGHRSIFSEYVDSLYATIKPGVSPSKTNEANLVSRIIEEKEIDDQTLDPSLIKFAQEVREGITDVNLFFERVRLYGITPGTKELFSNIKAEIVEKAEDNWYRPSVALNCYDNLASIFSYEDNKDYLQKTYVLRALVLVATGRFKQARNLTNIIDNSDTMLIRLKKILDFLDNDSVDDLDGFKDFAQFFATFKRWKEVKKIVEHMLSNGDLSNETKEMYKLAISMRLEEPLEELKGIIDYKDYTKKDMPFKSKLPLLVEETKYSFLHEIMPIITFYDDLEQGKRIIIVRSSKLSANLGIYMEKNAVALNKMESLQFISGHIKITSYVGPLRIRGKITILEDTLIDWHEQRLVLPNLV